MIDRRSEFTDPMKVEAGPETGEIPCRVLYCAPMNSNQKSNRSLGKQAEIVAFRISTNALFDCCLIHTLNAWIKMKDKYSTL